MPTLTIRTTRPLSTSAEVVLRPSGSLDDDSDGDLRSAISYVVARAGGPIVLDCADLTDVAGGRESTFAWFADEARSVGRAPVLRHVPEDVEALLAVSSIRDRFDAVPPA